MEINRDLYLTKNVPAKYRGHYRRAFARTSPSKAIRAKCLDCMVWQEEEVKNCQITYCPLWEYRTIRRNGQNSGSPIGKTGGSSTEPK